MMQKNKNRNSNDVIGRVLWSVGLDLHYWEVDSRFYLMAKNKNYWNEGQNVGSWEIIKIKVISDIVRPRKWCKVDRHYCEVENRVLDKALENKGEY